MKKKNHFDIQRLSVIDAGQKDVAVARDLLDDCARVHTLANVVVFDSYSEMKEKGPEIAIKRLTVPAPFWFLPRASQRLSLVTFPNFWFCVSSLKLLSLMSITSRVLSPITPSGNAAFQYCLCLCRFIGSYAQSEVVDAFFQKSPNLNSALPICN
jgi:hypothetical protein